MRKLTSWAVLTALLFSLAFVPGSALAQGDAEDSQAETEIPAEVQLLDSVWETIQSRYPGDVDANALFEGAVEGMLRSLNDPHSVYFAPDELQQFEEDLQGEYTGVGIVINVRDNYVTVVSVFPGSPAEQVGLQAKDRILAVDGEPIEADSQKAANLIRGVPGTTVRLTVGRPGDAGEMESFDVEATRDVVEIETVELERLQGDIAYIRILQFSDNTGEQFRRIYERMVQAGSRGVILDLRDNPGGYLSQGIEVAQALVPDGPIVHIVSAGDQTSTVEQSRPHEYGPPLVVLINGGTASASEIVAGAVQDARAGILLGTQSYGKGSVQSLFSMPNGGALKLTTAHYLTPKRRAIDGKGLTPDLVVERTAQQPTDPAEVPELAALSERRLEAGLFGLDVLGLQQRLNFLGYDAGAEDGIFGGQTRSAVTAFQQAEGLTATGTVEVATREALEEAVRVKLLGPAPGAGSDPATDLQRERAWQLLTERQVHPGHPFVLPNAG